MWTILRLTVVVLAAALWTSPSDAEVRVSFIHPETFRDAGRYGGYGADDDQNLKDFRLYLEALGQRYLGPEDVLAVDILDLDRAGRYEPWQTRGYYDVRIMRDVTWPRIKVRYELQAGDGGGLSGVETVIDMDYLWHPAARLSNDPLVYEKMMLDEWFRERFADRLPANR